MGQPDGAPDPLQGHLDLYRRLARRGRWKLGTQQCRLVATVLATVPLDDPYETVREAAEVLRKRAGWFGPLSSPIRYSVAAMIIRRGLPPGRIHDGVVATIDRMKELGLPRGSMGRVLASVLLVLRGRGRSPSDAVLERMRRIHRLWKADHPFLTGDDDYPMLALHALRDEAPGPLADRVESMYRELRASGLPRGNPLQLTSHILAVVPWRAGEAVGRFLSLRDAFERHAEKIRRGRFDEVALLALAPGSPSRIVSQVLADRDRLRANSGRPSKELAFGLAAGITLARFDSEVSAGGNDGDLDELSVLGQLRTVVEAQQAAMMIAITSATVAASSSS